MSGGNGEGRSSVIVPAVTMRSPSRTFLAEGTRSKSSSLRRAGDRAARCPAGRPGSARAETPKSASESSITTALPSDTVLTLPTRPLSLITGWSARTPSLEPLLISIVEYHVEYERENTWAVTGA